MRPTFSIICFTVLSGVGYGAWFLLGIGLAIGGACSALARLEAGATLRLCRFVFFDEIGLGVALLFVVAGLLASLGHLGRPARAWRALSQWRTSWLSREGVAALLTFVPVAVLVIQHGLMLVQISAHGPGELMTERWWNAFAWNSTWLPLLGALLASGSFATVLCTANIYASLKPVAAWRDPRVAPAYLLLALYGGTVLLLACGPTFPQDRRMLLVGVAVLSVTCAFLKHRYWRAIDALRAPDAGQATGLSALGDVRSFEAPHTGENYLTHEMGFVLARKHARKLRRVALVLAFLVPGLLALLSLLAPTIGMPATWIALASCLAGLFVERWLFFAEAKHAVMAYYAR